MANEPNEAGTPTSTPWIGVVALALGVAATAGQVHPTGYAGWDVVLTGLAAAGFVWAASRAPWWSLTVFALAAFAAGLRQEQWWVMVLAVGALVLSAVVRRRSLDLAAAGSAALALAGFGRLHGGPFFGATALFTLALAVVVAGLGLARHVRRHRRLALTITGAFAAVLFVCALGFGLSALQAKQSISEANQYARDGIALLQAGDFQAGSAALQQSADAFADADSQLSRPWSQLGRLVPAVAQNRATATRLVASAEDVMERAAAAAAQIDPEALRVSNHRIDLFAVEALQAPVNDLRDAVEALQAELSRPMSGWVPHAVEERIAEVRGDTDRYRTRIDNLALAVREAPRMLGSEGPRTYFVAFSTPAETRSIGGFVGNYALLKVDDGNVELSGFGRSDDLRLAAPQEGMDITLPTDFLRRYGPFNFEDPETGVVEAMAWKNIGITPDLPTMTYVVQQMYEATFGETIDGVLLLDPYPLAQMLEYTGPQTVPGYDAPIDRASAVDFVLRRQYLTLGQEERVDLLQLLAEQTLDSLLAGAMPSPATLARDLGPYVEERRLMFWTDVASEQEMLDAVGLSGRFPPAAGEADAAITFNNAAPNKVDAYMTHTQSIELRHDDELGVDVVDVHLSLANTMPATGMPPYVAGNQAGLPDGTMYLYVSVYGPGELVDAERDLEALSMETDSELGSVVAAAYVDVAPGETTDITVTFLAPETHRGPWTLFVAPTADRQT